MFNYIVRTITTIPHNLVVQCQPIQILLYMKWFKVKTQSIKSSQKSRSQITLLHYQNNLYLLEHLYNLIFYKLDLQTGKWTQLECNIDLNYSSTIIFKNKLVIFGGIHESCASHEICTFCFDTSEWCIPKNQPAEDSDIGLSLARYGHSAVEYDGKMIIFGGMGYDGLCNDIWSCNLETMEWTRFEG